VPYSDLALTGAFERQPMARLAGYPAPHPGGWGTPSYRHEQAAVAASWGMPAVRASSAGDLRMLGQAGGTPGASAMAGGPAAGFVQGVAGGAYPGGVGVGVGLPPMSAVAAAAAFGTGAVPASWRHGLGDLLPGVGMGRPRANSALILPGAAAARRGRMRSNSYTYGGYADFAASMVASGYPGPGLWPDVSPYGSGYLVSPASTDSTSTGGAGSPWAQIPPPPMPTPRHPHPMLWQQQQQQLQAHHAYQALLQQQAMQSMQMAHRPPIPGVAGAGGADAAAAGSNQRRRRHSVCMGDPRLQFGHQRQRRYSGMARYGALVLEMQPWSEVGWGLVAGVGGEGWGLYTSLTTALKLCDFCIVVY
jgi:hypothetical protein